VALISRLYKKSQGVVNKAQEWRTSEQKGFPVAGWCYRKNVVNEKKGGGPGRWGTPKGPIITALSEIDAKDPLRKKDRRFPGHRRTRAKPSSKNADQDPASKNSEKGVLKGGGKRGRPGREKYIPVPNHRKLQSGPGTPLKISFKKGKRKNQEKGQKYLKKRRRPLFQENLSTTWELKKKYKPFPQRTGGERVQGLKTFCCNWDIEKFPARVGERTEQKKNQGGKNEEELKEDNRASRRPGFARFYA